jgi:hypothetical protein
VGIEKEEKLTLWRSDKSPCGDRAIPGQFVNNFLLNWGCLYRERRWAKNAPSLGEVARAVNAYCSATGYGLFTLLPDAPLAAAVPYAPPEMEGMHEITGYDS